MPQRQQQQLSAKMRRVVISRRKHKQGVILRRKVLKMLAVMEPQNTTSMETAANSHSQEFLSTGRTGRRNALPDILSEHAVVSSGDLPARLQGLSTNDGASTSGTTTSEPSTSKQAQQGDINGS